MSDYYQKNKPQSNSSSGWDWESIYNATAKPLGQWWDRTQADRPAQPTQNPNKKVQDRLKGVADVFRDEN